MAESPAHKFGQVVGSLLEEILNPELSKFCAERGLFLDKQGPRPGVRGGKKVKWEDKFGNAHDLDFVIEKDGSAENQGRPVAFIEAAWRRYTKHSRNKVQEIQGAVAPLAETHRLDTPFLGAVLAGEFTSTSLAQLRSHNFHIVHFSYDSVDAAFATAGIDARFDETTSHRAFSKCVRQIESLKSSQRDTVKTAILASGTDQMQQFLAALRRKLDRLIDQIIVVPLFGTASSFNSADDVLAFLNSFDSTRPIGDFRKFDVSVRFSNGDAVNGQFTDRAEVERFLTYVTG